MSAKNPSVINIFSDLSYSNNKMDSQKENFNLFHQKNSRKSSHTSETNLKRKLSQTSENIQSKDIIEPQTIKKVKMEQNLDSDQQQTVKKQISGGKIVGKIQLTNLSKTKTKEFDIYHDNSLYTINNSLYFASQIVELDQEDDDKESTQSQIETEQRYCYQDLKEGINFKIFQQIDQGKENKPTIQDSQNSTETILLQEIPQSNQNTQQNNNNKDDPYQTKKKKKYNKRRARSQSPPKQNKEKSMKFIYHTPNHKISKVFD